VISDEIEIRNAQEVIKRYFSAQKTPSVLDSAFFLWVKN
jgi:hypothetical protein